MTAVTVKVGAGVRRTWTVSGWMNKSVKVVTLGGTRKSAKAAARTAGSAALPFPGKTTVELMTAVEVDQDGCRSTCAARRNPNAECVCAELEALGR